MRNKIKQLAAIPADEAESIEFREEWKSGFTGALKIMQIGHYYRWDADDFNRHSFHAIAHKLGIKIITKRCRHLSAVVVMRIS